MKLACMTMFLLVSMASSAQTTILPGLREDWSKPSLHIKEQNKESKYPISIVSSNTTRKEATSGIHTMQNNTSVQNGKMRSEYLEYEKTLDIHFLGIEFRYAVNIQKNWSLGLQLGGGMSYGLWIDPPNFANSDNVMVEFFYGGLHTQYAITNGFDIELGMNYFLYPKDPVTRGKSLSLGVFKGKKVQLGTRINFGKNESGSYLAYSSLLILRINLKRN